MLMLGSPFYEIEGVIVFHDHTDKNTFYYLAGPPHLTMTDGKPTLLLLKYRDALDALAPTAPMRDQLGGGFLMFGVDCGLSDAKKQPIVDGIESQAQVSGEVHLVPVLYTRGTVNVIALNAQSGAQTAATAADPERTKFVRGILGTATPSLLEDSARSSRWRCPRTASR